MLFASSGGSLGNFTLPYVIKLGSYCKHWFQLLYGIFKTTQVPASSPVGKSGFGFRSPNNISRIRFKSQIVSDPNSVGRHDGLRLYVLDGCENVMAYERGHSTSSGPLNNAGRNQTCVRYCAWNVA